jgi:hypothetical protein
VGWGRCTPWGKLAPLLGYLAYVFPLCQPFLAWGLCGVQPSPPLPVTWSPLSLACPPRPAWALGGGPRNGERVTWSSPALWQVKTLPWGPGVSAYFPPWVAFSCPPGFFPSQLPFLISPSLARILLPRNPLPPGPLLLPPGPPPPPALRPPQAALVPSPGLRSSCGPRWLQRDPWSRSVGPGGGGWGVGTRLMGRPWDLGPKQRGSFFQFALHPSHSYLEAASRERIWEEPICPYQLWQVSREPELRASHLALIHLTHQVQSWHHPPSLSTSPAQLMPWLSSCLPMHLTASWILSCHWATHPCLAPCCDGLISLRYWIYSAPLALLPSTMVATSHWRWWLR